MSVAEYAKSIGKCRQTVLYRIKHNKLPKGYTAQKIGKAYIITKGS
jgi:hypothetical protein